MYRVALNNHGGYGALRLIGLPAPHSGVGLIHRHLAEAGPRERIIGDIDGLEDRR